MSDHFGGASCALSIVIPTWNRAGDLEACLASIKEHVSPHASGPVETIVVDNGSTDATPAVVDRYREVIPQLRGVVEPTIGLAHGRNRGLREARSENVAFLDDDATVRAGWSDAVIAAMTPPDVVGVAGRIILAWPNGRPPRWFSERMDGWFTQLDLGDQPIDLPDDRTPWGANMVVRRSVAIEAGSFHPLLDRSGTSLLSGGEVEFFDRVRRTAGPDANRILYAPDAVVDHHVSPGRISLRWVARRAYNNGRSIDLMHNRDDRERSRVANAVAGSRSLLRAVGGRWGQTFRAVRSSDDRIPTLAAELTDRFQPLGYGMGRLRAAISSG